MFSNYSIMPNHKLLVDRGWEPTHHNEYKNPDAPGYSIDLDVHNPEGKGPFSVFRGNVKIAQLRYPPYASHLALRDLHS